MCTVECRKTSGPRVPRKCDALRHLSDRYMLKRILTDGMQCCLRILQIVLLHCVHAHNGCNVTHKYPIESLGLVRGILPRECHARSAHAVRSFDFQPILRSHFWPLLTSFWFHTEVFFSFLCIWDVAHLNCHPLLPNVNHFYPFFAPHIELSPLWGPREGTGDVAIHSPRTLRSLWYGLHPHHITHLARHQ